MNNFPDHPVVSAMEKAGQLPPPTSCKYVCDRCCAAIYEGDTYYEIEGYIYCAECIREGKHCA